MKKKKGLLAAVLVLALLLAGYTVLRNANLEKEETETEAADVYKVDAEDIQELVIEANGNQYGFSHTDDTWTYEGDSRFPLREASFLEIVSGVTNIHADRTIEDTENTEDFGLESPQVKVTVKTEAEESTLEFGDDNDAVSGCYMTVNGDSSRVYLVDSSLKSSFQFELKDLAEKESMPSITSSTITSVQIEDTQGTLSLKQDSASETGWTFQSRQGTPIAADSTMVLQYMDNVVALSLYEFASYDTENLAEYGLDQPTKITVNYQVTEEVSDSKDSDSAENDASDETSADNENTGETASEEENVSREISENNRDAEESEAASEEDSVSRETSEDGGDAEENEAASEEDSVSRETSKDGEATEEAGGASTDSTSEETESAETKTVDKQEVLLVGKQNSDGNYYVKLQEHQYIYTMNAGNLEEILQVQEEELLSTLVADYSFADLDEITFVREGDQAFVVTKEITEVEQESDEEEGEAETTTETKYLINEKEIGMTEFSTFFSTVNTMEWQSRDNSLQPEGTPEMSITFTKESGSSVTIDYYEYDTNFYLVIDSKGNHMLVNKMKVKDMLDSFDAMIDEWQEEA